MPLDLESRDRCFVIAEAGTGHADPDPVTRFRKALALVEAAAQAGADAVKFQWFAGNMPEENRHEFDIKRDMFCWIEGDEFRAPRWQASILGPSHWQQIKEFAEACGLVFLASAFQDRTVDLLGRLRLAATKVASRAAKTFPYEKAVGPIIASNGMVRVQELMFVLADRARGAKIHILECEAKYPSTRAWTGNLDWGFSDHSGRPFLGIDAIARGCKLLEVHYTVKAVDAGPDLQACLTPRDLEKVCEARDYYAERA